MPRHQKYSIDEIMDKIKEQYVDGPEEKGYRKLKEDTPQVTLLRVQVFILMF